MHDIGADNQERVGRWLISESKKTRMVRSIESTLDLAMRLGYSTAAVRIYGALELIHNESDLGEG
ncbi:hypothetical protein [Martelella soudanensis]|uniref:hypothetical protein n=1 Tax=unclassified Martelella TaxID=2629616 RepID=UPI0015E05CCD|nr:MULTISPECIES: hypothetical protein [unclassified Martelella]